MSDLSLETLSIHGHLGTFSDQGTQPPISMSSSFEYSTAEEIEGVFSGQKYGDIYSRISNPTLSHYENKFNLIEGGLGAVSFATGMAAVSASLLAFIQTKDHLIVSKSLFGGSYSLFTKVFKRLGIDMTFVNLENLNDYETAFKKNTKAVFLESIGNPKLDISDIQAVSHVAHEHNVPLIVDNTIPTPILMNTKELGGDITVYSTTKYIGEGQSLGGMVVDLGSFSFIDYPDRFPVLKDYFDQCGHWAYLYSLRQTALTLLGMTMSPFSAYLQTTHLDTLPLKIHKHNENAYLLASFLEKDPRVQNVRYPALPQHESFQLTQKQLKGKGGGIITFELKDKQECFQFINHRGWLTHLANIGDPRTLIIHPSSTIYQHCSDHEKKEMGVSERLIRVSVGLESIDDLKKQFDQTLGIL